MVVTRRGFHDSTETITEHMTALNHSTTSPWCADLQGTAASMIFGELRPMKDQPRIIFKLWLIILGLYHTILICCKCLHVVFICKYSFTERAILNICSEMYSRETIVLRSILKQIMKNYKMKFKITNLSIHWGTLSLNQNLRFGSKCLLQKSSILSQVPVQKSDKQKKKKPNWPCGLLKTKALLTQYTLNMSSVLHVLEESDLRKSRFYDCLWGLRINKVIRMRKKSTTLRIKRSTSLKSKHR